MQRAVAGEMGQQKFHLVSQNPPAREINVLRMRWYEGNGNKFHFRFFRCQVTLMVIAALASRNTVFPVVRTPAAQRLYMITG